VNRHSSLTPSHALDAGAVCVPFRAASTCSTIKRVMKRINLRLYIAP
jgi:hypothetical protein